jgi:hypothetical protein
VVVAAGGGGGFGAGLVGHGRGRPAGQGPVGTLVVVDGHELVQELLEFDQVGGLGGLGAQPPLQGLLEPLDLATGGGLVGAAVVLLDVAAAQLWPPGRCGHRGRQQSGW